MRRILLQFAALPALVLMATGMMSADGAMLSLTSDADTSIFSSYADNDFGVSMLECGSNGVGAPGRGLVHFDLSAIPAGSIITNAQITMSVVKIPPGDQHAGPQDSSYGMHRMLVPWVEGTGGGTMGQPAKAGETTWQELGAQGVASWGAPGGQGGTDFDANASTTASVGLSYGIITWGATGDFLADLQMWLDDPSTNFGYMMISDQEGTPGTARRLASRETVDSGSIAPTLTITYTVAPEPGTGGMLGVGALAFFGRRWRRGDGKLWG